MKKTYNLPPGLVDRARRVLGVRTETEAVTRALESIAADDVIARAAKKVSGKLPGFKPLR